MERVAIYLRKSRADIEKESSGEPDTLSRHRRALLNFAKERSLNIVNIYEEIVSGERIAMRPQMQQLLNDVENGRYQAVLVMDMDRLGRGNMQEQGLIIDTFREANTLIITPRKTYDLRNEMDEEWSEFEAFMARKELKIITRRLQSGRVRSAQEGNYNSTYPPFGYDFDRVGKIKTLKPNDDAPIVQLIFELYTKGNEGMNKLAKEMNERGILFNGKPFKSWNINQILKNYAYIGLVAWNKKSTKVNPEQPHKRKHKKTPKDKIVFGKGIHPPLISEELFELAQSKMKNQAHPSVRIARPLVNPLAGVLKCGLCGMTMARNCIKRNKVFVRCNTFECKNRSAKLDIVESEILRHMERLMETHKVLLKGKKQDTSDTEEKLLKTLIKERDELLKQKSRLHDLLEKEVYTIEVYLSRSKELAERLEEKERAIETMKQDIEQIKAQNKTRKEYIPALINVMKLYHKTKSVQVKNTLLKAVLHRVEYTRIEENVELVLYPKLPSIEGI